MASDKQPTPASETTGDNTPATGTNVVVLPARAENQRPSDKVVAFVKDHPVLTIAGGLAVGAAIAAFLPKKTSSKLTSHAFSLAEKAGSAGLLLGGSLLEKAEDAGSTVGKKAGLLAQQAERIGETAGEKVSRLGHSAWQRANSLGHAAAEQAERIGHSAADQAARIGDAAKSGSTRLIGYPKPRVPGFGERLVEKAHELRTRIKS